jgi:hypothetical protein
VLIIIAVLQIYPMESSTTTTTTTTTTATVTPTPTTTTTVTPTPVTPTPVTPTPVTPTKERRGFYIPLEELEKLELREDGSPILFGQSSLKDKEPYIPSFSSSSSDDSSGEEEVTHRNKTFGMLKEIILSSGSLEEIRSRLFKVDTMHAIIGSALVYYQILNPDNAKIKALLNDFPICSPDFLFDLALEEKNMEVITWCMYNLKIDETMASVFGFTLNSYSKEDLNMISAILHQIELDNECNVNGRAMAKFWWRVIRDYTHGHEDFIDTECPFDYESLEDVNDFNSVNFDLSESYDDDELSE